jgi:hypothetical protein
MRQSELFHRAAGCEHQRRIVTNPVRRKAFSLLRDMWIELANGSVGMSDDLIAHEVAAIEKFRPQRRLGAGLLRPMPGIRVRRRSKIRGGMPLLPGAVHEEVRQHLVAVSRG